MRNLFARLGWKLTLSYTLVTASVVLVLEIILLSVVYFLLRSPAFVSNLLELEAAQISRQVQPFMAYSTGEDFDLQQWLTNTMPGSRIRTSQTGISLGETPENGRLRSAILTEGDLVAILDPDGKLLGINQGIDMASLPETFRDPVAPAESQQLIQKALRGEPGSFTTVDDFYISADPIRWDEGPVQGVTYVRMTSISTSDLTGMAGEVVQLLAVSAIVALVGAGIIGTLFGFITAKGFTRRLQSVSRAADGWSRGDFSTFIKDPSKDEIGQLAQRLNRMAEQLENLLQTREELATLEERNRLARDLHDSVKQQVFATSMQVGAARALVESNPTGAQNHLAEAERLARQAQQELTTLIRELRPAGLEGKGLAAALREVAVQWSRETGIAAQFRLSGERKISLPVEQALYRVAQEALSNIARHSRATQVDLQLTWEHDRVVLVIQDNGRGFDLAAASGKGIGLTSMQERIDALGGHLEIQSGPGGTHLQASVPTGDDIERKTE